MIKKIFKSPELYCLILFLVGVYVTLALKVEIKDAVVTRSSNTFSTTLPYSEGMKRGEAFQVKFNIVEKFNNYDIRIVPDDCAEEMFLNGKNIDLRGIEKRCDFARGFVLQDDFLAPYRKGERNYYEVSIRNNGGSAGLNIFVTQKSLVPKVVHFATGILFAALCLLVARRLNLGRGLIIIFLVGVLCRLAYFAVTPYTGYSYDVGGHIEYIEYIMDKHSIPKATECWSCYHPPVYYVASIPYYLVGEFMGASGTTGLQVFSLLLSLTALLFGLLFLKGFLSGKTLYAASVLWTMWPTLFMIAPRIGNDQLFYALHILCLWGGINYLNKGKGKYLITSVVSTALAMWTKNTAMITLGMLLLFTVSGYVMNWRRLRPSGSEIVAWSMIFALFVGVVIQKFIFGGDLVANVGGINRGLGVGNSIFNYVYFDLKGFLSEPFTNPWKDEMGRQFFWNYTLKTALFGEFELVRTDVGRCLATVTSISLLALIVYAIRGFWRTHFRVIHWLLFLQGGAFFAALMFLRIKYPYACSNDFRFIVPVILSFSPFVAWGINVDGGSTKWKVVGNATVAVFVLSSAILYILAM